MNNPDQLLPGHLYKFAWPPDFHLRQNALYRARGDVIMETMIEKLRMALKDAIRQCTEHNAEYHHRTPDQTLLDWAALVRESETAAALTPSSENRNGGRRRLQASSWQPLETAPADSRHGGQQMLLFKGHSRSGTFEGNVYVSGWVDGDGEPVYDYKYKLKITGWKSLAMVDDDEAP